MLNGKIQKTTFGCLLSPNWVLFVKTTMRRTNTISSFTVPLSTLFGTRFFCIVPISLDDLKGLRFIISIMDLDFE